MDHEESVIIGLYPRRMGKSLFLGLLKDFLGVVSDTSYRDRRTRYEQYAIYQEGPKFFEDSIGRYAVFKLDLKLYDDLKKHKNISADDLPDIVAVLPALMKAFFLLLGHEAVVIIDEYDAPFIKIIRRVKDRDLRDQLFEDYNDFLSSILKGSPYLYKGVLAGVFDVRCGGIGSGLNNAAVFLAHSGVVDGKTNPFQRAFGFTAQNTWDVINQYVGKLWPAREDCTNVDEFKARVFSGLLVQCDGYRVGTVHRIFCPLAVMRFLARLRQVKTSEEVSFKGFRFWEETGRLTMIRSIKADSLVDLQRYLSHLTAAFHRQQEFQRNDPAMVQLESASSLDDNMIAQIASQPSEQNELAYGDDTEAQLVEICTAERVGVVDDLDVGEELTAATVMQLLYQAGYLVPVSDGRMAIPSEGVLSDLEAFYKKLKLVYNLRGNIGDYMARQMGVSDCDMGSFAASMR
ncbi:hypothetical protein IWQ56_002830, partial [Coemansia nantahalensis]